MAYSENQSKTVTIINKLGNKPYAYFKCGGDYTCVVDFDSRHPWAVKITKVDGAMKITNVRSGRSSEITVQSSLHNGATFFGSGHSWAVSGGAWGSSSDWGWWYDDNRPGLILDIRTTLGRTPGPHEWVNVEFAFFYTYVGKALGQIVSSNSGTYYGTFPVLTPSVGGNGGHGVCGPVHNYNLYAGWTIPVYGSWDSLTTGNAGFTVKLIVNGRAVAERSNASNGRLNYNWRPSSPGRYEIRLAVYKNGAFDHNLASGFTQVSWPPPSKPTIGGVNNTTPTSINTTRTKSISANWGVSYIGYPSGTVSYEYHCYSTTYGELASGVTTNTSHSFTWNMPTQDVRDNIYWTIRAKTSGNSLGWTGFVQSGSVEVYWAYTEPSKITAGSVIPNRFQLFNGTTNIAFTPTTTIGSWGDRPGTRSVEYGLYRNGNNILKWYGRLGTSSTGTFSQSLSAAVPETDLNNTYHVIAHKRLGDTEYTTSNDARYPTTGQNHATAGIISFYEIIGKIEGSFSLDPNIIISGLPNNINYSFKYDKQSSEKVDVFIEVYRVPTGKVTKTVYLNQGTNVSKNYSGTLSNILVEPQQADVYEIRLKATVTELLGNTHTYTLATLTPQVYNPPVGKLVIQDVSKPLPTNNATSLLAKQNTNITWNYSYSFQGVQINKVVLVIESQPSGREEIEVPFNPTTSPYYNNYTRVSTGDFKLGSKVDCRMIIYYQIIGGAKQYSVTTDTITIDITPTRYLYFLTRVKYGEQQLNKIHPLIGTKDKISEKIHID